MVSKNEAADILARRVIHLEERIEAKERHGQATSYDRAELSALRVALRELRD